MKCLKVVSVQSEKIIFEGGIELYSDHTPDCCEYHELTLSDLTIEDFEGLEFDLSSDSFFKRIPDYGIELIPIKGHSVKIPGHGSNNGYYSDQLDLVIEGKDFTRTYDITDCQEIDM